MSQIQQQIIQHIATELWLTNGEYFTKEQVDSFTNERWRREAVPFIRKDVYEIAVKQLEIYRQSNHNDIDTIARIQPMLAALKEIVERVGPVLVAKEQSEFTAALLLLREAYLKHA